MSRCQFRLGVAGCCVGLAILLGCGGGGSSGPYHFQSPAEAQAVRTLTDFLHALVIVQRGGGNGPDASRRICALKARQMRDQMVATAQATSRSGTRPTCAEAVASFAGRSAAGEARVVGLTVHGALATADIETAGKVSHLQLVRQGRRWLVASN